MKTDIRMQRELIEKIQKEPSRIQGLMLLRRWLYDVGYETPKDCKHYAVYRVTGKCIGCGVIVQSANPYDSDEALDALRTTLGG